MDLALIGIGADRSATVRGMCGRAILVSSVEDIAAMFENPIASVAHLVGPPRFNVVPGQDVVVE